MATTTDKISYATTNAIAITLNSLAASTTAGRSSAAVDNTTNLYQDALVSVIVKTTSGVTPGSDRAGYTYLYGSEDGTNYNTSTVEAVDGTDKAITFDSPTNLKGPVVMSIINSASTWKQTFSFAAAWGGILPRKWGIVFQNSSNMALTGTPSDHVVSYTGINYTNS